MGVQLAWGLPSCSDGVIIGANGIQIHGSDRGVFIFFPELMVGRPKREERQVGTGRNDRTNEGFLVYIFTKVFTSPKASEPPGRLQTESAWNTTCTPAHPATLAFQQQQVW